MKITLGNRQIEFIPWRPEHGKVFNSTFAFDCETTLLDVQRPWLTPAYVLGAACDGKRGVFVRREHVEEFFAAHSDTSIVMHHAPFDLEVINLLAPDLNIYDRVDQQLVWDTQLLHRLLTLGTEGHTAFKQSSLDRCVEHYLGIRLPKDLQDSKGNQVRLSYGQWLNKPPSAIEPVYLEYLAKDALATLLVFQEQETQLSQLLGDSRIAENWGYMTFDWLREQITRWGPQTHQIQLQAAIVLAQITANGLTIDLARRDELLKQLADVAAEQMTVLRSYGYVPGQKGCGKALQEILKRIDAQHPDLVLQRTATGKYATAEEALSEIASHEFITALIKHRAVEKLQSSFLKKMGRRVLHPSFDPLKVSGRTSSFGELNAQNLPRDDRVRSCFVPSEGNVYINADYSTLEMATLAQPLESQFGLPSMMAAAINAGKDLHQMVAARVAGKPEEEVTAEERQKAKPINFGKPGGMGNRTLKTYAKTSYGVELDDVEVDLLADSWFELFPEMRDFLADDTDLGLEVASAFDLTPTTYYEHTGSQKFLLHPANAGRHHQPHSILGGMCLKVLKDPAPVTCDGRLYLPEEVDLFWTAVAKHLELVPKSHHESVRRRMASVGLQRAVMRELGRRGVFTLTGRLRANATYAARHNTVFQGLAADGTKLALWKLWRAGYRIVNFIHDEVLIEVPADSDLTHHAETIRDLMIAGMREVVPDVRIDVQFAATDCWLKSAKAVFDDQGRLEVFSRSAAADSPTEEALAV